MVIENFIVPSQLPRRYHDGASLLDRTTAAIALGFVSVSLLVCLSLCLWHCLSLSLSVLLSVCLFVIVSRPYVASYKTALPSSLQFDSPLTSPRLDSVWFWFASLRSVSQLLLLFLLLLLPLLLLLHAVRVLSVKCNGQCQSKWKWKCESEFECEWIWEL